MRTASCRLMLGLLFIRQLQRRAVIDRRPPGRQLRLALQRQLFGRLVAGLSPASIGKLLQRRVILVKPHRLPVLAVPVHAHPFQIGAD